MKNRSKALRSPLFITLSIALCTTAVGQSPLVVDTSTDPVQLVEDVLVGSCVSVSNVSYNGVAAPTMMPAGIGGFSNGNLTNLGIDAGVILSTGDVYEASNPASFFASSTNSTGSDPDLELLAGNNINDRAVLEFDFIPNGDSISFRFVFASDEYPVFECSSFNDAFGFFISGPGINGPYANNAINVALIPGTTIPIAINTVNSGTDADLGGDCAAADPNWQNNSIYFVENGSGTTIAYGGFTTVLTAKAGVTCNETYHIKLAIGDAGDSSYDSAVFLEAGSFESSPFVPELVPGPNIVGNMIYESCLPLDMLFRRTSCDVNTTETVHLTYGGDAQMGVDLEPVFPDSLVFLPGDTLLPISFYVPVDADGPESFVVNVESVNCLGLTVMTSFTFTIDEGPELEATSYDLNIQCGDGAVLAPVISGGFAPYTMDWSNGAQGDSISVTPTGFTPYTATVTDTCGNSVAALFNVGLVELPQMSMNIIGSATLMEGCESNQINIIRPQGVSGDLDIQLTFNGTAGNGSDFNLPNSVVIEDGNFNVIVPFDPLDDGDFEGDETVMVIGTYTDACGRSVDAGVLITIVNVPEIVLNAPEYIVDCDDADSLLIAVEASGGYNDELTITWAGDNTITGPEIWIPVQNSGSFSVTATDACGRSAQTNVNVIVDCELIIPNVFTPNNDGLNDLWEIEGITYTSNSVKVFNRWGQVVFESSNYRNTWRAQSIPDGTYFYEIIVDRHDKPYTGHVTILRN